MFYWKRYQQQLYRCQLYESARFHIINCSLIQWNIETPFTFCINLKFLTFSSKCSCIDTEANIWQVYPKTRIHAIACCLLLLKPRKLSITMVIPLTNAIKRNRGFRVTLNVWNQDKSIHSQGSVLSCFRVKSPNTWIRIKWLKGSAAIFKPSVFFVDDIDLKMVYSILL